MPAGRSHFDLVSPTYLENWPSDLAALSLTQAGVALSIAEANALGRLNGVHVHRFAPADDDVRHGLRCKLDRLFNDFPDGAFVRLGSRSPKDTHLGILTGCRCKDGESTLRLLTNGSSRLAFDLGLAVHAGYAPHVFAREWLALEPWMELRCFMRERRLAGVGQYHHRDAEAGREIGFRQDSMMAAVVDFFPRFRAACHLDTAVFDVVLRPDADGGRLIASLLELSPWTSATDFGLFDSGNYHDMDRSFRYANSGSRVKLPLVIQEATEPNAVCQERIG